jgi:hypothetical protein
MKTETYVYNDHEAELEYQEQDGAFWPISFKVRVPIRGGFESRGEQYEQISLPTEEECLAMMRRDAQNFINAL